VSLALDTNVLIPWLVSSAPGHAAARALVADELARDGGRIALTAQVCWEFLHVVTDPRRFERPCSMEQAQALTRSVWNARDTQRVPEPPDLVPRVIELMHAHGLGRRRVLDTVLAASLERAGVRRLATLNTGDFACFTFLEAVRPAA
jgi:predicted nucleic acid-binding protein